MKHNISLILLFLAGCLVGCEQNQQVVIIGDAPDEKDSTEVSFCRSLDADPVNWCFLYDNALIKNGRFIKTFNNPTASTVIIFSSFNHSFQMVRIICQNGDSIKIKYTASGISFEGDNAKGNELIDNRNMFVGVTWLSLIGAMLEKENRITEAIVKIEEIKNNLLKPLDSLYSARIISKSFYKVAQTECRAQLLFSISSLSLNHSLDANFNLNDSSLLQVAKYFYTKYDPFSVEYNIIQGTMRALAVKAKCELINKGVLKGSAQDIGLWSQKEDSYMVYAPVELQHRVMTNTLLINQYLKAGNESVDLVNFNSLKKHFPHSPYIPVIQRYFLKDNEEEKISPYSFGHFDKNARKLTLEDSTPYKNIQALLRKKFPNTAVLVDVWATWCGPCKQAFKYADSVYSLCKSNRIELLYLSVDKPQAGKNWAKNIKQYELRGNHYFATDSINTSLALLIGEKRISIPRYLLFDKEGNLMDNNLPHPSQMPQLIDRVRKLLRLK